MKTPYAWLLVDDRSNEYKKNRLIEEAKKRAIKLELVRPDQFHLYATATGNALFDTQKQSFVSDVPDFVLSLIVQEKYNQFGYRFLEHLEQMNIPTLNSIAAARIATDKMHTYQLVANLGFPIPKTRLIPRQSKLTTKTMLPMHEFPLVAKPNDGLKGQNVVLINSQQELEAYCTKHSETDLLIQEYIKESYGKDLRIMALAGNCISAIERHSSTGFTSNVATGANGKEVVPPSNLVAQALRILATIGLEFGSVDFLYSSNGFVVCEVNANPGYTMFEKATKKNVAGLLLDYMTQKNRS
jgi:gamma-F420-2:alpha-L-glutamate ligase